MFSSNDSPRVTTTRKNDASSSSSSSSTSSSSSSSLLPNTLVRATATPSFTKWTKYAPSEQPQDGGEEREEEEDEEEEENEGPGKEEMEQEKHLDNLERTAIYPQNKIQNFE